MSNVTSATANYGLLNQLMASIGGVHTDIISSDQYYWGPPLLLRYYYKLMIRERIRQIVKEVLDSITVFVVVVAQKLTKNSS